MDDVKMEKRLSKIELSIVDLAHRLELYIEKTDGFHQHQAETQEKILEQAIKHNSRLTKLELWRAKLDGGFLAIRGVWLIVGGSVTAAAIGVFQLYLAYQQTGNLLGA